MTNQTKIALGVLAGAAGAWFLYRRRAAPAGGSAQPAAEPELTKEGLAVEVEPYQHAADDPLVASLNELNGIVAAGPIRRMMEATDSGQGFVYLIQQQSPHELVPGEMRTYGRPAGTLPGETRPYAVYRDPRNVGLQGA